VEFVVTSRDPGCAARCGRLSLAHGTVLTPAFAPVATRGTIKGILPDQLIRCGTQMLLANAYHLALSPGAERVAALGGLHRLMAWDRPILTDSGGFQVFSLASLRRITEDGVEFRSPLDGSPMMLGPREATRIQNLLGADIAMAFDECPPWPCSRQDAAAAVDRTLRWAAVCRQVHGAPGQALFGIVQGGTYQDLRGRCAEALVAMGFEGYAIGGVSVGEGPDLREAVVACTAPMLPADRPRYLMGVGFPGDMLDAVAHGIDLFDCVAPTRMGRNATAFTAYGRLRLRNSAWRDDPRPIEEACDCPACGLYSRACIGHLFRCREMLGPILVTLHNVRFYHRLMAAAREAIEQGRYRSFRDGFVRRYNQQSEETQS
jgi:queuine tRNA-ribosyltransferase